METVRLNSSGASATRIGLGCAGLAGRLSKAQSLAVLEAAAEGGVTHFDVARSYGYGGAERALGEFLRAHGRDAFTVTTKAGVAPPGGIGRLKGARVLARKLANLHPTIRSRVNLAANRGVREGRFAVADMSDSFATSLSALGVEQVDLLLVHECTAADLTDELREWLDSRIAAGETHAWGIAATSSDAEQIVSEREVSAVQVPVPLLHPLPLVLERADRLRIRHSVLREDLARVADYLADPSARMHWERELDHPLSDEGVALLLLQLALSERTDDFVLVGTQHPAKAAALGGVVAVDGARTEVIRRLVLRARDTGDADRFGSRVPPGTEGRRG